MRILFLLFFIATATQVIAGKCTLAKNGKPAVSIVIPKNAGGPVRFAASELKKYLDKMTGADFKITTKASGKAIYLGKAPGVNTSKMERDAMLSKL